MNERIKELAVKSGAFCEDEFGRLISWGIEGTELTDEVQKFAELIVKECLKVVKDVRDDCWTELSTETVREYMKAQSDDTIIAIKRHFEMK